MAIRQSPMPVEYRDSIRLVGHAGVKSIEHIEKYWCPSILGESLTKVIPGSAGPKS